MYSMQIFIHKQIKS